MRHLATFVVVFLICISLVACGGGSSPASANKSTVVSAISVGASTSSVVAGQTLQLTAIATYGDNSTKDVTATVTWQSSDTSVATISSTGLVTTKKAGSFNATASAGTISGSKTFTVTAPTLMSVAVAPTSATITTGQTKQLQAIGTYTDNSTQDISSSVTWSSTSTSVATVNGSGLVTAVAVGSTTVKAVSGTFNASASITVTAPPPPALSSILITPSSVSLAAGQTKQLKATGTYADGSTLDITGSVTWSSSSTAAATVDAAGLVTAVSAGQATISAVSGTITANASVNVGAAVLASIVVAPNNASIATGQTQQFTANGIYTDGSAVDITNNVIWGSETLTVATVNPATGLATGVSVGTANITATSGSVVGSAPLAVTAAVLTAIDLSPDAQSIPVGGQVQYTVTGTYSDGSTQTLTNAVFASTDPTIATVDPVTGIATGVSANTVTITATVGSFSDQATLNVLPPTLQSLSLSPATATLAAGTTQQFVLTGVFSDGSTEPLSAGVNWTSSAPAIAGVDLNGLTTAIAIGQTTVTASYNGLSASANVTVTAAVVSHIDVTPISDSIGIGGTDQFTATAVFTDGTTQDVTNVAQWISSSATVALVSNTGLANALSMGTAQITAVFQNVSGSATLNVTSAKLVSISVSPASPIVPQHAKIQFTATGTFSDGTTLPLRGVYWHSSSASRCNINSSGLARTKKSGSVTISATLNGVTGKTTMTVTSSSLASVAIVPATATIAPGTVQQFSLQGTFSDGTTVDVTKSAYWQTSNYHYAVINGSGVATGVATGQVTITGTFSGLQPATAVLNVSSASIVSVSVTPSSASIALGSSQLFKATGSFDDGSSQDITTVAQWTSSDPTIAVVKSTGLATSAGRGNTNINATFKSTTGSAALTVF